MFGARSEQGTDVGGDSEGRPVELVGLRVCGTVSALLLHAKRRIVQLSEILPLVGHVGFREDRRDRANGFARAAVDALLRMDEQLGLKLLFGNTGVWRDVRRFPAWDDGFVGPGS